ncbi:hypothetical protein B5M42_011120 [Paenibacillus athensensis]|uniref:Uncharacterized protein n=1 Tax=Paenibacillus athensensis TaxID=1967502 RepID=A0A4Y8PY48_9BACL|nr:hypothetical protein [Paenibacillus athensensis]MCD1259384.1 hypothetical protein [Paenibacillus athensensis]
MKTKTYGLLCSSLLFVILLVLTFIFKSVPLLYATTVCPLLIVPFMPDIRSAQLIRMSRSDASVRIIHVQGREPGPSDLFVIRLQPGYIQWERDYLYFDVRDAVTYSALPQQEQELAASMAVLPFDLKPHRRYPYRVGISLANLKTRTAQLAITTQEINRLVIRTSDLMELTGRRRSSSAAAGRSLRA